MKKRNYIFLTGLCLFLLSALCLAGCKKQKEEPEETQEGYQVYYLNKEETAVVKTAYEPVGSSAKALIEELLERLSEIPEDTELEAVLTDKIFVTEYKLEDQGQLTLYFDPAYQQMSRKREILCRSAVVRTLCQIPEVEYVSFLVGNNPLLDSKKTPIGPMSAESFVENTGEDINENTETVLELYFSNQAGDRLVKEVVRVHHSSNVSVEKLVLEQLIRGPVTEDAYPVIPPETKVLSVSTKDGICYVNLDDGFLGQGYNVTEAVPIYAIVNSLTEIAGISKVQILINGETERVYRESIRFDTIFERNLDIIEE